MKRFIAIGLFVALLCASGIALAEIDMELFDRAKSALSYISYGEYARALEEMGLSSNQSATKKLKRVVSDDLSTALYGEVQTTIAVCYRADKGYKLCVPVEDPGVGGVETLVLLSKDGESFSGYRAEKWVDCAAEAAKSAELIWCEPIQRLDPVIIAD